jgi:hypothetical protein
MTPFQPATAASNATKPTLCSGCGNRMSIAFIVPDKPGRERRNFRCQVCDNVNETIEKSPFDSALYGAICGVA